MSISLDAGVAILRVWQGEADRARGRARRAYQGVAEAIRAGRPLDEALDEQAPFFPPLLIEMARVGEQTGALPETLKRLAEHYNHRVRVAREFRAMIAWPVLQLIAALLVVGLLIAVGGVLGDGRGGSIDLLGFGLVGSKGLTIYFCTLLGLALALGLGGMALRRQPDWRAALLRLANQLPLVGGCLEKIALARIAWALRLLLNVELDLRRVAPLALRVSGNGKYSRHGPLAARLIGSGEPLSAALAQTGVFPQPFIDELLVAEESGRLVETMDRLSRHYEQQAQSATRMLAGLLGGLVWLAVAGLVITLIFRLFGFYTGALNDALQEI